MATNTAASFTNHTGNGTAGPFSISFSYLSEAEVDVTVGGVLKTLTTHYTFTSATQITFTSGNEPGNGVAINIQRDTNITAKKVDFNDGSVLTESDLDTQNDQILFAVQENLRKLDTIEESATGDQTAAEIRTLVESATDSNVFTDADHTKLNNIEASATADQTASEIRTLVESASDSNVFTDADHTKLNAIEANATADQTNSEIKTAYEANSDTNAFTDAEKTKLSGIETGAEVNPTNAEIKTAYEANSNTNAFTDAEKTKLAGIEASATADQSNAEIKTAYEANSDTNAFTDAEKTKLGNLGSLNALSDVNTSGVADGKILKYDASASKFIIADDGGSGGGGASAFTGLSDTPANFGGAASKTVKVNAAGNALEFVTVSTDVVDDTTPQLGGNLDVQTNEITTSTTNGNVKLTPDGTGKVEIKGNGSNDAQVVLNCSNNSHGQTIKAPPHSAGVSNTFTLPTTATANLGGGGGLLKVVQSGQLSFDTNSYVTNTQSQFIVSSGQNIEFGQNNLLKFDTDNTNGFNISFKGPNSLTKTSAYTLPEDGSNGQFLKTNGSGVLSFDTVDLSAKMNKAGDTITGDVTIASGTTNKNINIDVDSKIRFDDDLKATFGNGDDLQIYHDGSHSYIDDNGTGNLKIQLGGATKAEVVSTGLTVTGTLTATAYAGDGSGLTGIASTVAGGAIYENSATISSTHTIASGTNGMSAGPVSVSSGVTLTISSGSVYTVV
tara:strand:- start:877 stop:3063 length:2187 start_codon:yes stop_codon:yes gene_type:complete